jgi:hypothetical protein
MKFISIICLLSALIPTLMAEKFPFDCATCEAIVNAVYSMNPGGLVGVPLEIVISELSQECLNYFGSSGDLATCIAYVMSTGEGQGLAFGLSVSVNYPSAYRACRVAPAYCAL